MGDVTRGVELEDLQVEWSVDAVGLTHVQAERRLTDTALKDLKKRVEAD